MPAKHQNYSYTLKYQGPRLRCADVTNQTFFGQLDLRAREWASRIRGVQTWYNATSQDRSFDIHFCISKRNFTCQTYTSIFSITNGVQKTNTSHANFDERLHKVAASGPRASTDCRSQIYGATALCKDITIRKVLKRCKKE
ncbi:hypothetical protein FOXG_18737 [Fusarium oxysporum f. sp. lycopersici 4287]|uniref:Uncharacterized protein n=2 Tax=Fusarium oxysporum TaxID=5507 RepID=A0A0J9UMU7_FUSO4|nr:hypothetical protein FOXG_18737 [Fusarium oxysporum f. sp. lycopersici 4287]EXK44365.1 hypothetical protein FOMG_03103 [Fusarium oxysporum f. sp. melonis 26406]KNB00570.1 hypothetical protein FOXG_18737 [Fusarium oxysporum f. sp. lycopersici 4287]